MKTSAQRRLGPTAGLLLLSLLVLAIAAPAVLAAGESGSSSPPAGTQGRGGAMGVTGKTSAAGTEGRGGITASVPDPTAGIAAQPQSGSSGTSGSSGSSGTSAWVWIGIALAVLAASIATWAILRRRRSRSPVGGVLRAASRRRSLRSGLTRQREGRGATHPARVRSRRLVPSGSPTRERAPETGTFPSAAGPSLLH